MKLPWAEAGGWSEHRSPIWDDDDSETKKKRILTKDNLSRRGWKGLNFCDFCSVSERIDHLFFSSSFARFLWNVICGSLGNPKLLLSSLIFVKTRYHHILVRIGLLFLLVYCFDLENLENKEQILFSTCFLFKIYRCNIYPCVLYWIHEQLCKEKECKKCLGRFPRGYLG